MAEERPPLRLDEFVRVPIMLLGALLVLCTVLITDRVNAWLTTDEMKFQRQVLLDTVRENRDRYTESAEAYAKLVNNVNLSSDAVENTTKSVNILGDVIRSYERTLVEQKILEEERRRSTP